MSCTEALGYLASALVLATFCMRDMVALRCMAIASNLAFIAYGALADVGPVLLLHLLLLPVNVQRLVAWRSSMQAAAAPHPPCNFKETRHE
jgi:CRP/FNR family transcriptional regulator, cyclic AMP receptor protein